MKIKMSRQLKLHQLILKRPNGSATSTIRMQAMSESSLLIDNEKERKQVEDDQSKTKTPFPYTYKDTGKIIPIGALAILMQLLLDDFSRNRFQKFTMTHLPHDVWFIILNFAVGFNPVSMGRRLFDCRTEYSWTQQRGALEILMKKPTLFPVIKMSPHYIIEAILHGDKKMVMKIVAADPRYLTEQGTGIDLQGNLFTGTPLQAALRTTDMELCGKFKPYFDRIQNGDAEMHRQFIEIYKQSLERYQEILQLQITRSIANGNDAGAIIKAHKQAQKANAFNFQPYVDAIWNASQAELNNVMELIMAETQAKTDDAVARTGVAPIQTDEARAKSFDQLTLIEKLNRFREAFVMHIRPEIIFNPYHILTGLKSSDKTQIEVLENRIADGAFQKRAVIYFQLLGWAQRCAAEPVRQDIRQGTYFLSEQYKKEQRVRPSCFNKPAILLSVPNNNLSTFYPDTFEIDPDNGSLRCHPDSLFMLDSTGSLAVKPETTHMLLMKQDPKHDDNRNSIFDVSLADSSVIDGIGYKFAIGREGVVNWEIASKYGDGTLVNDSFSAYVNQKHRACKTLMGSDIENWNHSTRKRARSACVNT